MGFLDHLDLPFWTNWPLSVTIFEERGGQPVQFSDKARRLVNEDGKVEFRLKKRKFSIKPQQYSNMVLDMEKKSGHLYLWSTSPHEYMPITYEKTVELMELNKDQASKFIEDRKTGYYEVLGFPKINIKPIDEELRQHLVQRYRNAVERMQKPNVWVAYMPIIAILVLIIGGAILFTVIGQQIVSVSQQVAGMAGTNAQILDRMEKILRVLNVPNLPPQVVPPV